MPNGRTCFSPASRSPTSKRKEVGGITGEVNREGVGYNDEPAGIEASPGGTDLGPEDCSDIYTDLAAAKKEIMVRFGAMLAASPAAARRAIKDRRKAALAIEARKAKEKAGGRKDDGKRRKIKGPDRERRSPGGG